MKVLDLFAGSRSFSKVADVLGHETFSVDIKPLKDTMLLEKQGGTHMDFQ